MEQEITYKQYVEVGVIFTADGRMIPKWLKLEDAHYEIDRIIDCRRGASLKAGGCGMRYTVRIGSARAYLFYEDTEIPAWFVELKKPVSSDTGYKRDDGDGDNR